MLHVSCLFNFRLQVMRGTQNMRVTHEYTACEPFFAEKRTLKCGKFEINFNLNLILPQHTSFLVLLDILIRLAYYQVAVDGNLFKVYLTLFSTGQAKFL
jgi:hypothetical protein